MRKGKSAVACELIGHVARVTLDRPDARNALNGETRSALLTNFRQFRRDLRIRAIVITGAGDKAFSAGADIKEMAGLADDDGAALLASFREVHDAVLSAERPVIAAINGLCLGGGLELALVCDIRIAAKSARLGFPEIRIGTFPGGGGTVRLQRLIGRGSARALCLTGDFVGADRAYSLGLVSEVVADQELEPHAMALATRIAACSRTAVAAMRHSLDLCADLSVDTALKIEAEYAQQCFAAADRKEGMRAFLEKRAPRFEGLEPM